MDRLTAAKIFLETVARGSISAAAAHLDMSRAMATRYIALMEEWAEVRLLHRTTRRLSLTAAGEQLLPICKELVALSADVKVLGSQPESAPKGLLRVTAPSIFAEYCLTDVLMEFLQLYPAVAVDLQIADRITNLAEEGIDLAIRVTDNLDPGVIAKKLGQVESFICASPAYIQRHGVPRDVRDLAAHNCLTYAYYGRSLWHFIVDGENVTVPVTGSFSTNEASIIVRAALSGTGVAMLPHFAAERAIKEGHLIRLFPEFRIKSIGIHAVYLSRQRMPNALKALIDFLSRRLAD
ncbi:HTH-type transcriptional regulator DmlR [Pseudomonas extremaustralis]|uniref:HTH-type transcriptional regulator DmlR n=1 Tax=Pseudomonas extremaustralis TaxID=359110 RepID=A0A5M9J2A6_9PSED|nr:LysR family transcriptional regulator [Pseudomonas extremaustralis]KAA8562777.1 HTH-type transcriptional regulator DmlR [Pseudomonas extremaustralis]